MVVEVYWELVLLAVNALVIFSFRAQRVKEPREETVALYL